MKFKGMVLAYEDSSFTRKNGQRDNQETLTCLDADPEVKMKDTVDCVFPMGTIPKASELVGKTVTFNVDSVRPGQGMRCRFVVKSAVDIK
jgi:hypothetical protein